MARYLQRRLQGSQLSTPPPPSVLFSNDHRARARQATHQRGSPGNGLSRNANDKDGGPPVSEDYDDYVDDLEGYEDSERSRTRFDLLAGKLSRELTLNNNRATAGRDRLSRGSFSRWRDLATFFWFSPARDRLCVLFRAAKEISCGMCAR